MSLAQEPRRARNVGDGRAPVATAGTALLPPLKVIALAATVLGLEGVALAAGPLGSNGQKITTSQYGIDLFQGPIYAGSRVTAMGGAYVAVAWDVDGMLQNPAAPAVRPFFSVTDFDYWLGFGLTFPGSFEDMDFYNSGSKSTSSGKSFVVATPSAMVQFGSFGFGASLELQNYQLGESNTDGETSHLALAFNIAHLQAAYAFDRGALVLGLGTRILLMDAATRTGESRERPMRSYGTGLELGALWKPTGAATATSSLSPAPPSARASPRSRPSPIRRSSTAPATSSSRPKRRSSTCPGRRTCPGT